MIPDGYRVFVVYDSEKQKFVARIPELGDVKAMGETRSEALTGVEEALEASFRQAAEEGKEMPKPIDGVEFSGELTVTVSPHLHRELAFLASKEGIELSQLAAELLSAGLALRSYQGMRKAAQDHAGGRGDGRQRRGGGPRGKQYFDIMDDRANFIDYVRKMEKGGRGGGGGGGGGGGRGGGRRGGRSRGRKS